MDVLEYGPDVLFVHQGIIFFEIAKCCVVECSEDIKAGLCLSVYIICVLVKRHDFSYVTPSVVAVSV